MFAKIQGLRDVMPSVPLKIEALRRYAIARSLFSPTTLPTAIKRLGFVQADPIRAPARAQDLILRHRVKGYRAGDLEKRYAALDIEEDFFVNYGFLPTATQALMHPRTPRTIWPTKRHEQAKAVLAFVQKHSVVHPREVDAYFSHGRARGGFGGLSNVTTQLLDDMHYRGMLRIAKRISGVRTYEVANTPLEPMSDMQSMDALVDVIVNKYAPLPERSLVELIRLLRGGVPQWDTLRGAAFANAKQRLANTQIDGVTWYWPSHESPQSKKHQVDDHVRLLAPFDPVVWDRRRFELFWGWAYRFEAYTPAHKRVRGYYAMPLLWREEVIGWGNIAITNGTLTADLGYVNGKPPRDSAFKAALDDELARMSLFLA
jgi:uncharacterized protein